MERQILFRGKRVDNEKWIKGIPVESEVDGGIKMFIIKHAKWDSDDNSIDFFETDVHEVIPSTIRQFTGLTDKNGKKIFEGDIIRVKKFNNNPIISKVVFNENTAGFEVWWNIVVGAYGEKATRKENFAVCGQIEVIGNIYDNPELLK